MTRIWHIDICRGCPSGLLVASHMSNDEDETLIWQFEPAWARWVWFKSQRWSGTCSSCGGWRAPDANGCKLANDPGSVAALISAGTDRKQTFIVWREELRRPQLESDSIKRGEAWEKGIKRAAEMWKRRRVRKRETAAWSLEKDIDVLTQSETALE